MVDLLWFVRHYKPGSPHHIAAFNELMRHIPEEQLRASSEWVTIFNEEVMEWRQDEPKK